MDEESLGYLDKSGGFDLATAPSLVVADEGVGGSMSVASMQHGIAAFIWGQKGLMGGIGLQGTENHQVSSRASRLSPNERGNFYLQRI